MPRNRSEKIVEPDWGPLSKWLSEVIRLYALDGYPLGSADGFGGDAYRSGPAQDRYALWMSVGGREKSAHYDQWADFYKANPLARMNAATFPRWDFWE